jgi:hypothetical protein
LQGKSNHVGRVYNPFLFSFSSFLCVLKTKVKPKGPVFSIILS